MIKLDNLVLNDDDHKLKCGDSIEFMGLEAEVTAVDDDKYTLLVEFNNGKHTFIEIKREKAKEKVKFT